MTKTIYRTYDSCGHYKDFKTKEAARAYAESHNKKEAAYMKKTGRGNETSDYAIFQITRIHENKNFERYGLWSELDIKL
jgi:viroplasmin and RNaseH domain-containing protein